MRMVQQTRATPRPADTRCNRAHRAFCFTVNNPSRVDLDWASLRKVRYAIWQVERTGRTGTRHLQGYVELSEPCRWTYLRSVLGWEGHVEPRYGDRDAARAYCRKRATRERDGGPFEYGSWEEGGQGTRTDLEHLEALLRSGATEDQIRLEAFGLWARYHQVIQRDLAMSGPWRTWRTEVHVLTGDPGTGKSEWCRRVAPGAYYKQEGIWWDGYRGRRDVVLDGFSGRFCRPEQLQRLCGRDDILVETKGGQTPFVARRIFILSYLPLEQWYPGTDTLHEMQRAGLLLRLDSWSTFLRVTAAHVLVTTICYDMEEAGHGIRSFEQRIRTVRGDQIWTGNEAVAGEPGTARPVMEPPRYRECEVVVERPRSR